MKTISSYIRIPVLGTTLNNVVLVVIGSLVVALCAQISIPLPFTPVPITGQTFGVLLVGIVLGARKGALSLALYLVEGTVGLPVFAGGAFHSPFYFSWISGPNGGYLWGFVAAAYIIGLLAERGWDRSILSSFIAMIIGNIVLYIPGLLQLGFVLGWDKPIFALGFFPFIIGDLIKAALAAALLPQVWKILKKRQG